MDLIVKKAQFNTTLVLQAGCGVKPGTSVQTLDPLAAELEVMLVMTVEPGFGGQSFMQDMMPKVIIIISNYATIQSISKWT